MMGKWKPLVWDRIEMLLTNDHALYPTDSPVTIEVAKEWFKVYPDCAVTFESDLQEEWANILIVPLSREGWELVIDAKDSFKESQFRDRYLYCNQKEVAFHIYHVEKHRDKADPKFRLHKSLKSYVNDHLCQKVFGDCQILGFSAYCVTNDGIR